MLYLTGERQAGINFDILGSWNSRLDLEVNVEQSIKSGRLVPTISTNDIGHSTAQGRRKDNQDRVKVETFRIVVLDVI